MKKRSIIPASILIAITAALGGCSETKNESIQPNMNIFVSNSTDKNPSDSSSESFSSSGTDKPIAEPEISDTTDDQSSDTSSAEIPPVDIAPPEDKPEVIYAGNIAIVRTHDMIRAMIFYGANPKYFKLYAEALNKYKEALPDVSVYSMVVPVSCEFYAPPEVAERCASQRDHINIVNENLIGIQAVDAYSALTEHIGEEIYLRTDHHWAQLGGYYAAEAFAKAAGVPFLPLSDYETRVNTGFCGSMLGYSENNEILKNNPEDFIYYVPTTVNYTTTYYNYIIEGWDVVGAYNVKQGSFFLNFGDNKGENYCTFMGGDAKIVHVQTDTKNDRRLLIIKDSYGNAVVPNLFGSFEEIYVTDLRFFSHNMISYIKEHNITDLLFLNNTTIAGSPTMIDNLDTIRTQRDMGF